ncbi:MAG: LysR family transcriptional regulator, partial [Paraperlucidibaca sp.]
MRDLNDMQYFAAVVRHSGFAAASRAIDVPKATLSRRVAALEARLHVQLLHRGSRLFQLTELGQAYYQHCQAMLIEADAADEQIARLQTEPQGTLRLSCPPALMNSEFAKLVAAFMAAYPRVNVHAEVTNRVVDVQREGIDLAIRVRFPPLSDSDLVMRNLAWSCQRW